MSEPQEAAKHVVDALSVGTVIASLAGIVPSIAALFTIIWTGIRIYETDTVQKILGRSAYKPGKGQE
jgi:hypothetical protein